MSALGPYADLAQQVYDVAVGLPDYAKRKAEKLAVWAFINGGETEAHDRIVEAAEAAGRYEAAFGPNGRWGASIAIDAFSSALEVQRAVLCRDLISDQDYRLILGWWVKAGLADPHGVVAR